MSIYSVAAVLLLVVVVIQNIQAITSPVKTYINYTYSTELQNNVADLWWSVDEAKQEILFELHIKTTGWIALGISPAGGMTGADIGVGWVDSSGRLHFQDRYASKNSRPIIDNTTIDWFGLQGREQDGWTAIQFKRALDTCDTMDVVIKSGTNILIFAYGLTDPVGDITYHNTTRRGSRILPLRSYGNPSAESKFNGLDYFDFKLNNYVVPSTDTTYHCKVYKIPSNITTRRHVIAHKTLVESANIDIVHHVLMHECDSTAKFDDDNLPDDLCDNINDKLVRCASNIATGWAVGGDAIVEFPEVAGYPVGGDFEIKYYMIQMHYDNPKKMSNRRDSSGIRFYLGEKHRKHELGYLSLGTISSAGGVAIPAKADRFIIDSYCPTNATKLLPKDGITVVSSFPHTHLQGRSLWTKIIRNRKAVDYLFNADSYDFNYQFENRLPKPIQLYPGDEFATRCIYNTMNKNETTLGGERTKDEMCLHMLTYYPRVNNFYGCMTSYTADTFKAILNQTELPNDEYEFRNLLMKLNSTPELIRNWQKFYDNGPRYVFYGRSGELQYEQLTKLPEFKDLEPAKCQQGIQNSAVHLHSFFSLFFFCFFTYIYYINN